MDKYLAAKIAVIESEKGWGRKIDDYMICLSVDDANAFKSEFNAKNVSDVAPDWYMQVDGDAIPIDLTKKQHDALKKNKRLWLSKLPR